MSKALRPYLCVPDGPFKTFLQSLDENDACSAVPDIVENASGYRYFLCFMGENSSARQTKFRDLLDGANVSAKVVHTNLAGNSARMIIYLLEKYQYQSAQMQLAVRPDSSGRAESILDLCRRSSQQRHRLRFRASSK
jgi:hypothetical protein